ncbi:MAG: dockerin type I repeat-containing protein [Spirochaetales bacterium]|nr:dockerin type I repeat-containing protein [Spirochaetales bacterium]
MKGKTLYLLLFLFLFGCILHAQGNVLVGDVNESGTVDIVDALQVAMYYVNPDNVLKNLVVADVDCNQTVNIVDALQIARYYVGVIDDLPGCEGDNYPTTIMRLTSDEQKALQQDFERINGADFYGTVGPFGFLEYHYVPLEQVPKNTPLNDEEAILEAAANALMRNITFTNIFTDALLDNYRIINRSSYWTVEFRFDSYEQYGTVNNGIPARETTIIVEGTQKAFCIEYYYYPFDIVIPPVEKITPQKAMELSVGRVITYYNVAGEPVEYSVTAEDITEVPSVKYIIPYETEESLQYRYCWQVSIAGGMWDMYIDVVTGEVIDIEQHFQT